MYVVFIIYHRYNCEDPNCYMDLTRLRGLKYVTWENLSKMKQLDEVCECKLCGEEISHTDSFQGQHPSGGAHAKFTNYLFDKHEFLHLAGKAIDHVKRHPEFKNFVQNYDLGDEKLRGGSKSFDINVQEVNMFESRKAVEESVKKSQDHDEL